MTTPASLYPPFIPLNTPHASLETVGGKGANLVKLANAGFSVPNGFIIPTSVYRDFIQHNALAIHLTDILQGADFTSPEALTAASGAIRARFRAGIVPPTLTSILELAWRWLGARAVAVRSSATAEDLPELSFAGQQDTFLNVTGDQAILESVTACWSSLWTARAIGYRARNDIPHTDVSLAVIVQNMVQSEASGVLFTANPLTGKRGEVVIDAALGLGEALVGGHVEPDHYIVDAQQEAITHKYLGSKAVVMSAKPGGGVEAQAGDRSNLQALPDAAIVELARTGKQIDTLYGVPQDIEWAWLADSGISILQSRPITSLFPIPEGLGPEPLKVFFSFGAVQGLLDPMTPLGQDTINFIFAGGVSLFGIDANHVTQGVLSMAGERLWADLTPIFQHPIGKKAVLWVFPGVEPGSIETLKHLAEDPHLKAGKGSFRLSALRRAIKFMARMMKRILPAIHNPEGKADQIRRSYQAEVARLQRASRGPIGELLPLKRYIELYSREMFNAFVYAVPEIVPGILGGMIPLVVLNKLSNHLTGSGITALEITRGMPNNVTTEMDLILWETARMIRSDTTALNHMQKTPVADLAAEYLAEQLPEAAQQAVTVFMDQYGVRGLGEIDFGRPRWRENPVQIMQMLLSYLQIEDETMAPDVVFKRGEKAAMQAAARLEAAARDTFGGAVKARVIREAARRVRALAGLRESPKFYIIQVMGVIRQGLLDCGQALVDEGLLNQHDDLFYLYFNELEAFEGDRSPDWKALIAERRANYNRELRRKQIPRMMLSDGRTFYEGMTSSGAEEGVLKGSPVSPGIAEGTARVVFDPHHANLTPGEILVCPGTDPAWTPLFLAAGGLVTEVGGLMTHGAIVAREYGIPAVVGVDRATELLNTGDRIRVDGSTGLIERID
jgi:rifampicin phosphotransferase